MELVDLMLKFLRCLKYARISNFIKEKERGGHHLTRFKMSDKTLVIKTLWDFPGSPVVRTPRFHCRGHGWIPGRGTKIPRAAQPKIIK